MGLVYFKRYRMEIALASLREPLAALPADYELVPWRDALIPAHAEVKYLSFCYELDANVFPCLGSRDGCLRLMNDIARRDGFCASATWLLRYQPPGGGRGQGCGTVQGVADRAGIGAIQNLGISPEHRGKGLGSCLLDHALWGFRRMGLTRAYLEVTAQNTGAVRLYERLGFRRVKTVYKAAEVAFA